MLVGVGGDNASITRLLSFDLPGAARAAEDQPHLTRRLGSFPDQPPNHPVFVPTHLIHLHPAPFCLPTPIGAAATNTKTRRTRRMQSCAPPLVSGRLSAGVV